MNRRDLLRRIGGVGLTIAGIGTLGSTAGATDAGPTCVICQDDPGCADVCEQCLVARCPPVKE